MGEGGEEGRGREEYALMAPQGADYQEFQPAGPPQQRSGPAARKQAHGT